MKTRSQECRLDLHAAKQVVTRYMARFEGYCNALKSVHRSSVNKFLCFIEENARPKNDCVIIDHRDVIRWVDQVTKAQTTSHTAAGKILCVEHFLEMLSHDEMISYNPIKLIKDQFGERGWLGIVSALRSHSPEEALQAMRSPPLFSGEFGNIAESYIKLQQSIGGYYDKQIVLAQFNRFLNSHSVKTLYDITESLVRNWINGMTCSHRRCKGKLHILKRFFDYACDLEAAHHNPVSDFFIDSLGCSAKVFEPYIYTHDEIGRLLAGARKLSPNWLFTLKPQTLHMIIILLYGLGLRIGEALRLTIMDVDLGQETLFVRDTKFYKDRIVPFGPKLGNHLKDYLSLRYGLFKAVRLDDPLFVTRRCARIGNRTIQYVFLDVLKAAQIVVPSGKRGPRLHDLRHTFAVHRLLQWYEEGVNVQDKLPLLSTFMGHVDIYSSQVYLTITNDILREANE